MRNLLLALVLVAFAGCAASPAGSVRCRDCGTVRAVDVINQSGGQATGAGALIGAVIGGVIGHQVGSGRGQDAATAGGAVAGAVVGHEAEKARSAPARYYRVTIDMDSGSTESVNVVDPAGVGRGTRVRVVGGRDLEIVSP